LILSTHIVVFLGNGTRLAHRCPSPCQILFLWSPCHPYGAKTKKRSCNTCW